MWLQQIIIVYYSLIYLFVHLFINYLLSAYHKPDAVLVTKNARMSKADMVFSFKGTYIPMISKIKTSKQIYKILFSYC